MGRKVPKSKRRLQRSDGGRIQHVSPHPPTFISMPWYNLVVRISLSTTTITTNSLRSALITQFGIGPLPLPNDFAFIVRFQRIRIWGAMPVSTVLSPLSVLIFDPIGMNDTTSPSGGVGRRVLEQVTDYPNYLSRSVIAYQYPKAQREMSVSLLDGSSSQIALLSVSGNATVVYFDVQWRFYTSSVSAAMSQAGLELGHFSPLDFPEVD